MNSKPIIGITCNFDTKDEVGVVSHMGLAGQKWHFIADNYVASVEAAGGIPVLIPICGDLENAKLLVERMDGVLISGGHDVNPEEYGERVKGYCGELMLPRDRQDIDLTRYLLEETDKPVLGICRGTQIINVAAGGTLYQDLKIQGGFEHHSCEMYPMNAAVHSVTIKNGSKLSGIYQNDQVCVNSFHHQGVKDVADGYMASAVSEDGVTEGIERIGERFVLGVQWHPEMMYDSEEQQKVFRAFVEACR